MLGGAWPAGPCAAPAAGGQLLLPARCGFHQLGGQPVRLVWQDTPEAGCVSGEQGGVKITFPRQDDTRPSVRFPEGEVQVFK